MWLIKMMEIWIQTSAKPLRVLTGKDISIKKEKNKEKKIPVPRARLLSWDVTETMV